MTASSPAPSRSPSTDLAISVEAASKRYLKLADTPTLVGRALQLRNRTRRGELWALRDVSFTAERGECLGFIGRNGSGKSTLLRMLAGVTAPSRGAVEVRGRVAPLIAVGVGFHPELTGRENVVVSSAILGRDPAATAEAFDEIVAFADIGDFLDTPVKFYSSGMFVRLGFAVAISIAPEVLLVDEVLAVGDIGFQQRCFARIDELRAAGTTIVLVSHNLNAVRRLCDRTGVLHDGTLRHLGDTGEAIALFQHLLATDGGARAASALQVRSARLVDDAGADAGTVAAGQRFSLDLDLACTEAVDDPVLTVQVVNDQGVLVFNRSSEWDARRSLGAGDSLTCRIDLTAALATGAYEIQVGAAAQDGRLLLPVAPVGSFFVRGAPRSTGIADLGGDFTIG